MKKKFIWYGCPEHGAQIGIEEGTTDELKKIRLNAEKYTNR